MHMTVWYLSNETLESWRIWWVRTGSELSYTKIRYTGDWLEIEVKEYNLKFERCQSNMSLRKLSIFLLTTCLLFRQRVLNGNRVVTVFFSVECAFSRFVFLFLLSWKKDSLGIWTERMENSWDPSHELKARRQSCKIQHK